MGLRIKNLRLENFQGLRDVSFDFDGRSGDIIGDNGTGKSTVFNSVTWLLYGKSSTGSTGFSPKTRGPHGELHHLNHSVYGEFLTDSGRVVTLQKVFHEVYKKKRGSIREEFSGHTIDYYLDGVPVKEKEYSAAVLSFCGGDAEKTRILTVPEYFAERMPWEARRKILLEVCGDITDEDVIARTSSLKELPDFLRMPGESGESYSIEQYRKIVTAQRADINKALEGIPARIDEASKAIPDITALTGIRPEDIAADIAAMRKRIETLTTRRAKAAAGSDAESETQKAVAALKVQIAEARAKYMEEQTARSAEHNAALMEAIAKEGECRRTAEDAEAELMRERTKRDQLSRRREEILAEYRAIAADRWNPESEICPTCGQALPADKVEQMRSDFNLSRSRRLMDKEKQGQQEASKTMIAECDSRIAKMEQDAAAAKSARETAAQRVQTLRNQTAPALPFESTPEFQALNQQLTFFQNRTGNRNEGVSAEIAAIDEQIQAANAELQRQLANQSNLETARQQQARIAELETQEKRLAEEFEQTEKGLHLCDEFTRAKVAMLTDRINGKFRRVRFQLFTDQINGGVKEGCEVLVPNEAGSMVPYQDANNAARINAGLEIIETLSQHWGLTMPVFVDNAEGIQATEEIHTQLIQLVVPLSWDKLSGMVRDLLVREYGAGAQAAYEAENKRLRLELRQDGYGAADAA